MAKNISDLKIWHKIFNKLNQEKLAYVLVGGAALVIHGIPRSTLDMDIYIPATAQSLNILFKIADSLNLRTDQKSILLISHSPKLFVNQWLCFSYKGEDILDVFLAGQKGFNRLYANSEKKGDQAAMVRVASLKDIVSLKKKSGRPADLADLKVIEELKKFKKS